MSETPQGYQGPLPAYYLQSSAPQTPNLGLTISGVDPIVAYNFVLIDNFAAGGGGGGTPSLPFNSVQFNNAGAFGGSANLTWTNATSILALSGQSQFLHGSTITPTADFTFGGAGSGSIFGFPTVIDIAQEDETADAISIRNMTAGTTKGALMFVDDTGALGIEVFSDPDTPSRLFMDTAGGIQLLGGNTSSNVVFELLSGGSSGTFNYRSVSAGPTIRLQGRSTGSASISVAAAAGSPNDLILPTTTGASGTFLRTDGGNPQQLSWVAGNSGTVTTFSAGNLSPLFTTSVATATTTPALTFALSNAGGGTLFGNNTTSSAAPAYTTAPVLGIPGTSTGSVAIASSTASGKYTITAPANAATPTLTLPTTSNVLAGQLAGDNVIYATTLQTASAAGTLTIPTPQNQNANIVFAGPSSGGAASPTFRSLVATDIPNSTITPIWNNLQNATGALTLANAGNATTFNQTSAVNWTWANTTAATSTISQASPIINFNGMYWSGSSATDSWKLQNQVVGGTNGASTLLLSHTGSTGTAALQVPTLLLQTTASATLTNTVSDTMARADENPMSDGGSWTVGNFSPLTTNAGKLLSNKYLSTTTNQVGYVLWTASGGSFTSADQYSSCTIAAAASTSTCAAVVRGSTAATTMYRATFIGAAGTSATVRIDKYVTGTITILASTTTTVNVGDVLTCVAVGTSIQAYVNSVLILAVTDSSVATGLPGMLVFDSASNANSEFSSWAGGTVTGGQSGSGALTMVATTAATSGTVANSPVQTFTGQYWNGSASAADSWTIQNIIGTGTNGSSTLTFTHSTGSSGTASVQVPILITGTNASIGGIISSYAATTTVGQGVPSEIVTVDLTAQSAAKTTTNLTASAPRTGMYRISWSATITTAATTSSVLGGTNGFQVGFTSPTDSVAKTVVSGNSTTSAANTTGTAVAGSYAVYAKTGTAITYAFDYTSVGVTAMVFELHVRLEAM